MLIPLGNRYILTAFVCYTANQAAMSVILPSLHVSYLVFHDIIKVRSALKRQHTANH